MTRIFYTLCAVLACTSIAALECGPNQVKDDCPSNCPAHYCPKNEHQDKIICKKPTKCPTAKCQCQFNYRFADNGTCIPTRDCPPFECTGENEEFKSCPSYCPSDDCSQATPDGRCPYPGFILIAVECSPQCRCIEGYWRLNGQCVPYARCHL